MKEGKHQKQENSERIEETRYVGAIPDEILEELSPEIIKQYYIWDEVMKREIELHSWLVLPLIKEAFHKTYPEQTGIRMIATEYVVRRLHREEGSTLNSIYADIAIQIGKRDIYHLECQMNKDKGMILRMLEYDIHIGLVHGVEIDQDKQSASSGMEMFVPRSVVLYLNHEINVPSEETCLIRFADGTAYEYHVPVMKVQDYSLEMIEEKHLIILMPFLPIRFRKYLQHKQVTKEVRNELTEFIMKCIMIIEREKANGTLTELAGEDMIEFLSITCDYLFKDKPDLYKEVHEIMNPTIKLTRERAEEMIKLTRERADEIVKLTRERADEMIKLQKELVEEERAKAEREIAKAEREIAKVQEEAIKAQEEAIKAQEEAIKAQEEAIKAQEEAEKAQEERTIAEKEAAEAIGKIECSIKNLIQLGQQNGQSFQETQQTMQNIFSMSETEAAEKMKEYWKNDCEV